MPTGGVDSTPLSPTVLEQLAGRVSEAEQYLRQIAETFPGAAADTDVQYGDPAERILAVAPTRESLHRAGTREEPMVVMASHGRSGLQRSLLGSITARVVQISPFLVFVVRGSEASPEADTLGIQRVLITLDGSTFSEQALTSVERIFGPGRLNMVLLRVVETQRALGAYDPPLPEEYVHSTHQEAEAYLEEMARQVRTRGHAVTCDLSQSRVAERINASAHSFGADLIAMATHGRGGLSRFMLGSVAEQALHEAQRPVLLVRPPEQAQQVA